ncbi:MAG: ParB/RepB/Spo0J family partition protein [Pseudomonadota bacterium]|nr:ParB/RepB/Spo0J family partition protein [Pseudomonadota bacterium]
MIDNKSRPNQLGRGLEALFGESRSEYKGPGSEAGSMDETTNLAARTVSIAKLVPNPLQPRSQFDESGLDDLTESIKQQGILQPLIVRPNPVDKETYEIIAGERRWRAAQRAQVHEAPVIVRDLSDSEAFAVALIENIQRDQLSSMEEAAAYARLAADFNQTQEQIAQAVGKSRPHISNTMRLLDLPEDVQTLVVDRKLTAGHARAVLGTEDPSALASQIVRKGLSVREAERRASGGIPKTKIKRAINAKTADTLALEGELTRTLGAKVVIDYNGTGGSIRLNYRSLEQLDDIIERLRN